MGSKFVHKTRFYPAFDDPVNGCEHPTKGDHGRGSVRLVMSSALSDVAVALTIYTDWHLPETYEKGRNIYGRPIDWGYWATQRLSAVLDIHSPRPLFDGHPSVPDCEHTGGVCYPDAAHLAADDFVDALFRKGDKAVWPMLDSWVLDRTVNA